MRYFLLKNNKVVNETTIITSIEVVNNEYINTEELTLYINSGKCKGIIAEINNPSYEYLIKHDAEVLAVCKYREKNKCTLMKAREAIKEIIQKMEARNV